LQLDDKYGSPSLDEVSKFSQEFSRALDAKIGEEAAGKLSVEVSSPVSSPLDVHMCAFLHAAEEAVD
jgi:ribosome maturation factor RimP